MNLGGALYALLAYGAWGITPIYWKWLSSVGAAEVMAHRLVWTTVFTALLIAGLRRLPEVRAVFADRRLIWIHTIAGALLSVNWGIFIWAVENDRIIDTSLGYYLNPLFNVVLAVAFLGERLRKAQSVAVALAAIGVLYLLVDHGALPWISLVLAVTFGGYGLLHKLTPVRPIPGLLVESAAMTPFAVAWLAFGTAPVGGAWVDADASIRLLLVGAGIATAAPLLWFASAARRLTLTTLGFFQYLAPTLALLLAVFLYGEPFGSAYAVAFGFIWCALAVFTIDSLRGRSSATTAA